MLLTGNPTILVLQFGKKPYFEQLGVIENYKSLMWDTTFSGCGEFKLWAWPSEENKQMLVCGNVVWNEEDAFLIQKIDFELDEDGYMLMCISGKSVDAILGRRVLVDTYMADRKHLSDVLRGIVRSNFTSNKVNKLLGKSRASDIIFVPQDNGLGPLLTFQKTGIEVIDELNNIVEGTDFGWKLKLDFDRKKLVLDVKQIVDKTSTSSNPIVLDADLEDVLSATYSADSSDFKTVAYVFGEGEGKNRKSVCVDLTGELGLSYNDYDFNELYVDAKDLQSTCKDENGNEQTMPDEKYLEILKARGKAKLAEHMFKESFDIDLKCFGKAQYKLGADYTLGDKVTVIDRQIGVQLDAVISKVEESVSDKYKLVMTFGDKQVSLLDAIRKKVRG